MFQHFLVPIFSLQRIHQLHVEFTFLVLHASGRRLQNRNDKEVICNAFRCSRIDCITLHEIWSEAPATNYHLAFCPSHAYIRVWVSLLSPNIYGRSDSSHLLKKTNSHAEYLHISINGNSSISNAINSLMKHSCFVLIAVTGPARPNRWSGVASGWHFSLSLELLSNGNGANENDSTAVSAVVSYLWFVLFAKETMHERLARASTHTCVHVTSQVTQINLLTNHYHVIVRWASNDMHSTVGGLWLPERITGTAHKRLVICVWWWWDSTQTYYTRSTHAQQVKLPELWSSSIPVGLNSPEFGLFVACFGCATNERKTKFNKNRQKLQNEWRQFIT